MSSKRHLELLLEFDEKTERGFEEFRRKLEEKQALAKIEKIIDTGRVYEWQTEPFLHIVEIFVLPLALPVISSMIFEWIRKGKIVIKHVNLEAAEAIAMAYLRRFRRVRKVKVVNARPINGEYEFEFKNTKGYRVIVGKDGDVKSSTMIK
jgi:putative component of toxin-antitoxin plasmid stabilization module